MKWQNLAVIGVGVMIVIAIALISNNTKMKSFVSSTITGNPDIVKGGVSEGELSLDPIISKPLPDGSILTKLSNKSTTIEQSKTSIISVNSSTDKTWYSDTSWGYNKSNVETVYFPKGYFVKDANTICSNEKRKIGGMNAETGEYIPEQEETLCLYYKDQKVNVSVIVAKEKITKELTMRNVTFASSNTVVISSLPGYDPEIVYNVVSTHCTNYQCNNLIFRPDGLTLEQNDTRLSVFLEFEETSGTVIYDTSGKGITAIGTENTPQLNVNGVSGRAINFTGANNQRIRFDQSADNNIKLYMNCTKNTSMMISFWVSYPKVGTMQKFHEWDNGQPISLSLGNTKYIGWELAGHYSDVSEVVNMVNNTWMHIVWTNYIVSGISYSNFFFNGRRNGTKDQSGSENISQWHWEQMASDLFIGADMYGNDKLPANMKFDSYKYGCFNATDDWVTNEYNKKNRNVIGNTTLNFSIGMSNTINVSYVALGMDAQASVCFKVLNESVRKWRCSNTSGIELTGYMSRVDIIFMENTTNSSKTPILKSMKAIDTYKLDIPTVTSLDGSLRASNATYNTAHDSISASLTSNYLYSMNSKVSTINYVRRTYLVFNTTFLPDDINITYARIWITPILTQSVGLGKDVLITKSLNPSNNLIATDFDVMPNMTGSRALSNIVSIDSSSNSLYVSFSLNTEGILNINKTGLSKYALRCKMDVDRVAPTDTVNECDISIRGDGYNNGTPILQITYTSPDAEEPPACSQPATPSSLTNPSNTSTSAYLSWTGVTGEQYYIVYRNASDVNHTIATTRNDTGLTAETSYSYYIKAYNSSCAITTSNASNTIIVKTRASGNTCTYTSGNWNINCADNCDITTNYNTLPYKIIFTGTGEINFKARLKTNFTSLRTKPNTCQITVTAPNGFLEFVK